MRSGQRRGQVNLTARPVGDVSVELAESADPIQVGTSFGYAATVRNLSGDASGVHLTVPIRAPSRRATRRSVSTCERVGLARGDEQLDRDQRATTH